jgi:heme iron utilization protein
MQSAAQPVITPRGLPIKEESGLPFAANDVARNLLRTVTTASLATLDPVSGYPYTTVTNLAVEADGTPYFFVAWVALHARNLDADNRVSMTLAPLESRDVLVTPRLTLVGRVERVPEEDITVAERRYLARYPKSKLYMSLPDARLYRLRVEDLTLSGGPARNAFSSLTPASLQTDVTDAAELLAAESDEIAKLNALPEEASRLAVMAGEKPGRWRVTGIDPDGLDLASPDAHARFWFAARVLHPAGIPEALKQVKQPAGA